MGAFNMLTAELACPNCAHFAAMRIQFKYGHTWQLEYRIGDLLTWGGNEIGERGAKQVLVEAIAGPCSHCGSEYIECEIVVERDVIAQVRTPLDRRVKDSPSGFFVIE